MDRSTEEQYHHSLNILFEKYELGFISYDELKRCCHWVLDDLCESVETLKTSEHHAIPRPARLLGERAIKEPPVEA